MSLTAQQVHDNQQFEAALQKIREDFIDSLIWYVLTLENSAEDIRANGPSTDALDIIRSNCHKLAGTAPTLGFVEIGIRATQLETNLRGLSKGQNPDSIWAKVERPLEKFLNKLEAVLDESTGLEPN